MSNDCTMGRRELPNSGLRAVFLRAVFLRAGLLRAGILLLLAGGTLAGCSKLPPRIHPASIDQDAVTESIIALCDQDNDGGISEDEAASLLAIKRRFSMYDVDKNKKVTPDEIKGRLTDIFDPRAALVGANCLVSLGGRPLSGALVKFVPEECMADVIPPAEGVTDEDGNVELGMATEDLPPGAPTGEGFVRPGLYRVVITHPKHKIPAKYNQETTLGEEVSRDTIMRGAFRFALTKK